MDDGQPEYVSLITGHYHEPLNHFQKLIVKHFPLLYLTGPSLALSERHGKNYYAI